MSVGVCIINRNGIALAADSAGTYTGNKMFYNSMNKVFSLSRKYIYGAITYGATIIYNVSIDQVLKEFRSYLDSKEERSDFLKFFRCLKNLFPKTMLITSLIPQKGNIVNHLLKNS